MEELPLSRRIVWLLVPLVAGVVAMALVPVLGDYERWTVDSFPQDALVIGGLAAIPALLMLAFLRTTWAWTAGVLTLAALCVAAPLAVGIKDESSTSGIALMWIPFGGVAATMLIGVAEAVRSRCRGPGLAVRR